MDRNIFRSKLWSSVRITVSTNLHLDIQQGIEIHGLEECGPWRYTVLNWIPKKLEIHRFWPKALKMHGFILVSKHLRYTVLAKSLEDARFFSFGVLDSKEI